MRFIYVYYACYVCLKTACTKKACWQFDGNAQQGLGLGDLLSYIIIIKINIYIYSRLFKNSTLLKVGLFGVTNFSI